MIVRKGRSTVQIERTQSAVSYAILLTFLLFNILPTLLEIGLVAGVLFVKYSPWFAIITFVTLVVYIAFTLVITEWRMVFRRAMNDLDSKANTRAIDSLINYETVKYFGNETFEAGRYDESMAKWEKSAVQNEISIGILNSGQSAIIALGVARPTAHGQADQFDGHGTDQRRCPRRSRSTSCRRTPGPCPTRDPR